MKTEEPIEAKMQRLEAERETERKRNRRLEKLLQKIRGVCAVSRSAETAKIFTMICDGLADIDEA